MKTHQSRLKPRTEYLQRLIKVITGVRRSGKSTLFSLYIDYLQQQGVREDQIIAINLDELEYEELLTYRCLYSYISERLQKDRYTYIFIDEVQQCNGFEKAVNSLYTKDNVDIYITGSNARLLSGELATLLSGRHVEIHMLWLSFREYLTFIHGNNESLTTSFIRYMQDGSFPYIPMLNREEQAVKGYIEGISNTILVKDVAIRKGITDISLLEQIVRFLGSAIGSPLSAKKIADTIASTGRKISVNTVDTYLKALVDSYIFYKANRFDIKGKNFLKTLGTYYIVDLGLRNTLLIRSEANTGHQIENIVYLELLRRGYSVSIGKVGKREVDFVAIRQKEISYYQVSATVLDETTLRRELTPLQAITDSYPKILLTLDEIGAGTTYAGIVQRNLLQWLTEDV